MRHPRRISAHEGWSNSSRRRSGGGDHPWPISHSWLDWCAHPVDAFQPKPFDLVLEVVGHVLTAVVVSQLEALDHARLEAAEVLAHALTYGLERLEAIRTLGGVDADTLRGAMIDSDKDGDLTISHGCYRGQVRAPHLVDPLGCDGAI